MGVKKKSGRGSVGANVVGGTVGGMGNSVGIGSYAGGGAGADERPALQRDGSKKSLKADDSDSETGGRSRSRMFQESARNKASSRSRTQLALPHSTRVMVEGYGSSVAGTFMGAVNEMRTKTRLEMLETAANFYHEIQRGVPRALTRADMKDNIHVYVEAVQEWISELYKKATDHRASATIGLARQAEAFVSIVGRACNIAFAAVATEHWTSLLTVSAVWGRGSGFPEDC